MSEKNLLRPEEIGEAAAEKAVKERKHAGRICLMAGLFLATVERSLIKGKIS